MRLCLAAALLLAACDRTPAPPPANQAVQERVKAADSRLAALPFAIEEKTDLYEFDFSWPGEAAAIPALAARLKGELEATKAELVKGAKDDRAWRTKDQLDYNPHSSSTAYETAGQSARLLSLRVDSAGYTGGAHGNSGSGALLWDRRAGREIKFADLFAQPANRDRLLTQGWCDSLNAAREQKRGEPVGGDGMFDECPALDDIAIIPLDRDKDGRFEQLALIASPYIAGPYAEGAYEIELPMTPDIIAALKADYRSSFAA